MSGAVVVVEIAGARVDPPVDALFENTVRTQNRYVIYSESQRIPGTQYGDIGLSRICLVKMQFQELSCCIIAQSYLARSKRGAGFLQGYFADDGTVIARH